MGSRRALAQLGRDVALARRRRGLTALSMAERIGVAKSTYLEVEKGDPSVAMGTYAITFFILGLDDAFARLADPRTDDAGLLRDAEHVPQRVRAKKKPVAR